MRKSILLSWMALPVLMHAMNASASNLDQVYEAAKANDATYAAATAAQHAGQEKLEQGRALWRPQVAATADYSYRDISQQMAGARDLDVNGRAYGYGVSVSQPIYNAVADVGRNQLKEQATLSEVSFASARQDLILRAAKAYFDVLFARDNARLVQKQKSAIEVQLARAKKSFDVGVANVTDVDEAQASFDAIVAADIAAQDEIEIAENALLKITGLPSIGQLAPLRDGMVATPPDPEDVNGWLEKAERASLVISGQRGELAIATSEIDKYRLQNQATLTLVAGYSGLGYGSDLVMGVGGIERSHSGTIGLQLNVPLYTGGRTSSKLRESLALRDQAQSQLEAARRDVQQSTRAAFLSVRSGASQIKALGQAVVSARSQLESTSIGLEVGVRTMIDVLNAEQSLYAAERDLARARYAYILNRMVLSASVSELSEEQLHAFNAQFLN